MPLVYRDPLISYAICSFPGHGDCVAKVRKAFSMASRCNFFRTSGVFLVLLAPLDAQVTVPMSQYDYERTGANLQEWILHPSNVNSASFGKLFSRSVDASVYALPLIVPNLNIAGER